jgi:hypothetical protein
MLELAKGCQLATSIATNIVTSRDDLDSRSDLNSLLGVTPRRCGQCSHGTQAAAAS